MTTTAQIGRWMPRPGRVECPRPSVSLMTREILVQASPFSSRKWECEMTYLCPRTSGHVFTSTPGMATHPPSRPTPSYLQGFTVLTSVHEDVFNALICQQLGNPRNRLLAGLQKASKAKSARAVERNLPKIALHINLHRGRGHFTCVLKTELNENSDASKSLVQDCLHISHCVEMTAIGSRRQASPSRSHRIHPSPFPPASLCH